MRKAILITIAVISLILFMFSFDITQVILTAMTMFMSLFIYIEYGESWWTLFFFNNLATNTSIIMTELFRIYEEGGNTMITLILILLLIGLIVSLITIVGLILTIGWIFIIPLVVDIITICIVVSLIKRRKEKKDWIFILL